MELQHRTETAATAVLAQNVSFVRSVMANLLAKNDSVSYDMHVAAFQTMLVHLEEVQTDADGAAIRLGTVLASHAATSDTLNTSVRELTSALTILQGKVNSTDKTATNAGVQLTGLDASVRCLHTLNSLLASLRQSPL